MIQGRVKIKYKMESVNNRETRNNKNANGGMKTLLQSINALGSLKTINDILPQRTAQLVFRATILIHVWNLKIESEIVNLILCPSLNPQFIIVSIPLCYHLYNHRL